MQRSNLFLKIISAAVLLALICYMGVYVFNSVSNPFKTALAVSHTITHGYEAQGMLVRSETVLSQKSALLDIVPESGEKVSSGGLLAVEYDNEAVLADAYEMQTLEAQIAQMEEVLHSSAEGAVLLAVDTTAGDLSLRLQQMLQERDFAELAKLTAEFQTLTYYSGDGSRTNAETRLAELKNRLYALKQSGGAGVRNIYAQSSGLFSPEVDGFEFLTPQSLGGLNAAQLEGYLETEPNKSGESMGKLVSGVKWYYAALIPSADAKNLRAGQSVRLKFDKYYGEELEMTVQRIGDEGKNGKTLAVFACGKAMSETISARKLSGKVVSSSVTGIRVPKEAVKLDDDGKTCVYTLTGAQAELKYIDILDETGDYYIVETNRESTSALRAGDEIIVSAKKLYDGKVVK